MQVHTQNHTEHIEVDLAELVSINEPAQPTNLAGEENAFVEIQRGPDGVRYKVYYAFAGAEIKKAHDDASFLPWDAAHIVRITLAE